MFVVWRAEHRYFIFRHAHTKGGQEWARRLEMRELAKIEAKEVKDE